MSEWASQGRLYVMLCKTLGRVSPDEDKNEAREREIRFLETHILELEKKERALYLSGQEADAKRAQKEILQKKNILDKRRKVHLQSDFKRAMRITRLGLKVEEVLRFASIAALFTLILSLIFSIAIGAWLGLEMFMIVIAALGCCIAVPVAVFMGIVSYPERLAKSMELEAFGLAPEIINYMVMSMELAPSLDRALLFAAENAEGPMANELQALVWKVQTRESASTEEVLAAYALELEGLNEEMRSAIYNILSASKESNPDTMRSSLRRASELVLTGTRQRVEEFSTSLGTPATILFGLGILLPMIIGSLLPMISFGGFDAGLGQDSAQSIGWHTAFFVSFFLMDILFPGIAFFYSRNILSRRPGIHSISMKKEQISSLKRGIGALILFAVSMALARSIFLNTSFWGMEEPLAGLVILAGIGLSLGYLLGLGSRTSNSIEKIERLEDQMPDMLFQLGSRLTEGLAIEQALEEVARSMKGTEIGAYLNSIIEKLLRSGQGLEELLFGDNGMLLKHPSRKLRATMKLVVEASGKNPELAGKMLMSMSNHMRELAKADRDMRVKLRSTIDSMRNTALFFAPVIMGVTVGLYRLLSQTFGEIQGTDAIPELYFVMLMGIYLLMTVAIIIAFCSGIENGPGKWQPDVAVALPVAAIIFSVTSLGALMAFG